MKYLLVTAAIVGSVRADGTSTDVPPEHTVYNCLKVRQDVDEANDMIGNGVCNEEVNCGPYSYDLGDCWGTEDDTCQNDASWYTNGKENFRCSTRTGGIRLGRAGDNDDNGHAEHDPWSGACNCYEECLEIAQDANESLVAFDMYSGKCRCWGGVCNDDEGSKACFNGGDSYGVGSPLDGGEPEDTRDAGNNWRCPALIYYPELKYDCDGRDITFRYPDLQGYIGDGFCDDGTTSNQQYAFLDTESAMFNFNCEAFDYDGGDCKLQCHTTIYWETDFVNLGPAYHKIDTCNSEVTAQTEFTTACECYTFCAGYATTTDELFLFDHDDNDMCRCFFSVGGDDPTLALLGDGETTFCGLNSDCAIYEPNRVSSCDSVDFTLGVYDGGDVYNAMDIGEEVDSFTAFKSDACVSEAFCQEHSYSDGNCFDCTRFSTDKRAGQRCTDSATVTFNISLPDLQSLVDDGYLMGATGTSLDGDNCACLNYCFSNAVAASGEEVEDVFAAFNLIAEHNFAYAEEDDYCKCYTGCDETESCGVSDCTVWYSTVADLNDVDVIMADDNRR